MLSTASIKAARPKSHAYKLPDGQGLHLYIAPSNLRSWRWRFRFAGREQLLTIGQYPDVDLAGARAAAEAARDALRAGKDPRAERAARVEVDRTFAAVARAWHAHWRSSWTDVHAGDVITSLERDVFPTIGAVDVDAITATDVRDTLRAIEVRGAVETARRVRQRISKVFAFAIANELAHVDPSANVRHALSAAPVAGEQLALETIEDARALLAASAAAGGPAIVELASRFLALTGVRQGALRGMRWDEVEGVDWTGSFVGPVDPIWRIPAARMKLARAKKDDPRNDHFLPLSRQAVEVLRAARALGHGAGFVFGRGDYAAPIAESAIGALYRRAGFAGRHVPHGWRATFSTIMNERHPAERVTIDRALGHAARKDVAVEVNIRVEGAYNRSKQLGPRRWLMQVWADLLLPAPTRAA